MFLSIAVHDSSDDWLSHETDCQEYEKALIVLPHT